MNRLLVMMTITIRIMITLNFNVSNEHRGTAGLRMILMEIFSTMKDYCKDLAILSWFEEKDLPEIRVPEKLPETITLLQKYFPGVRPMDSGGMDYSKVYLAFPITADRVTFERDYDSWVKGRAIRFYKSPVQHSNVKTACWLPYLTRHTDCATLSAKITTGFEMTMKEYVPIGLFWRGLNGQRDTLSKGHSC